MRLPLKLIELRKEAGLTQIDLAEQLDVSRQAISKWEVGTAVPGTDKLRALSELYGVSVDYLLNDDMDRPPEPADGRKEEQKDDHRELALKEKTIRRMGVLLGTMGVLMIALILIILLCVTKIHRLEEPEVFSITDLSCDQIPNDYPVETVHLIPMD